MNAADLDALPARAFCAVFDGLLEHCAWAVEAAAAERPLGSRDRLEAALERAIRAAPPDVQLAALRDHPRLAAGVAPSAHSAREQAGAGLNALTVEQKASFDALNARYLARHGFPFIVAVTGLDAEAILARLRARLARDTADELATALDELVRIVHLRVRRIVEA